MSVLKSRLKTASDEYRENAAAMRAMVAELRAKHAQVRQGGDALARERHVSRGKLLARERIAALLDPGSDFLELSTLAAYDLYENQVPAAGIVTGIGRIHGRECVVIAGHRADHVGQFGASRFHALNHTTPPRINSLSAQRLAERGNVVGREAVVAVEVARLEVDPARIVDVVALADRDHVRGQEGTVGRKRVEEGSGSAVGHPRAGLRVHDPSGEVDLIVVTDLDSLRVVEVRDLVVDVPDAHGGEAGAVSEWDLPVSAERLHGGGDGQCRGGRQRQRSTSEERRRETAVA